MTAGTVFKYHECWQQFVLGREGHKIVITNFDIYLNDVQYTEVLTLTLCATRHHWEVSESLVRMCDLTDIV